MKALVFHGLGDIRLDEVKTPQIQADQDAIVQITLNAICGGTDLHMVRGTLGPMKKSSLCIRVCPRRPASYH